MGQMGFFDIANRYAGLDAKNDPLVKIDEVVPWEDFRPRLEAAWRKPAEDRKSPAGRKPWDALVMFKAIVLCALYNLSDDQQVVQEYLASETLHGLARRHNPSRTLIRIWVDKHGAGTFDEGAEAENTIPEYEARIAALGYLSPNRFEEEQLHKPVKSAA